MIIQWKERSLKICQKVDTFSENQTYFHWDLASLWACRLHAQIIRKRYWQCCMEKILHQLQFAKEENGWNVTEVKKSRGSPSIWLYTFHSMFCKTCCQGLNKMVISNTMRGWGQKYVKVTSWAPVLTALQFNPWPNWPFPRWSQLSPSTSYRCFTCPTGN